MSKPSKSSASQPAPSGRSREATPATTTAQGAKGRTKPPAEAPDPWTEVANFIVTFEVRTIAGRTVERRVIAHKMQEGGITARWTGAALQPLRDWIAENVDEASEWQGTAPGQGDLPSQEQPAAAPTTERSTAVRAAAAAAAGAAAGPSQPHASPALLAIACVVARQAGATGAPAGAREATAPARAQLRGGEDFELDARIEISCAPDRPVDLPCKVEFFSHNMATKERVRLGEVSLDAVVRGGAGTYRAKLGGLHLPRGTYRLNSIASLPMRSAKFAHAEGPILDIA